MAVLRADDLRSEAVRIALTGGLTRRQMSTDLGVGIATLSIWISRSRIADMPPAINIDLAKEKVCLHKENRLLWKERELIKNTHWLFGITAHETKLH